ncbi:MAG TPA: cytochrome c3 family protein [Vicinamibacterales bacterium]|nr:cytochrome c3 family protein [Vicinamibacterales bacterium]
MAAWLGVAYAKPEHENVHHPDADCTPCHGQNREILQADSATARTLLVPNIDDYCYSCHDDEGPSHHVGIKPKKPVPDLLPLSGDGLITCGTCHFVHGEKTSNESFERIDNSRGGLCLTCHELSELQ